MRVWKKVPGLDCLASNDGRIRQINSPIKRIQEEFERPQYYDQAHHYKIVKINSKSFYVHRLVAAAFYGSCSKGIQVDHIDGNRLNNSKDNLQYITPWDNAFKQERNHIPKINAQKVEEIKKMVKNRRSLKLRKQDIAKMYNISMPTLYRIVNSKDAYF